MNAADWIIIVVILLSVAQAASSGFFKEAFGIAGLVIGYLLAAWQYHRVAEHFAPYLKSMWLGEIAGFLLIFFGVMILAGIAGRITHWAVKEAGLSFFDRLLGAVFGLARGCLFAIAILMAIAAFRPHSTWAENSRLSPYFLAGVHAVSFVVPHDLQQQIMNGAQQIKHNAPDWIKQLP